MTKQANHAMESAAYTLGSRSRAARCKRRFFKRVARRADRRYEKFVMQCNVNDV